MPHVIGARFRNAGKRVYFDPGTLVPAEGEKVIVQTDRGLECVEVSQGVHEISDSASVYPLDKVVRIVTPEDEQRLRVNRQREEQAYEICRKKIEEHRLDMKLVNVEYTFDNSKLIAYFTSNGRVDFRSLVKDLAGTFKTRIELKQIGVRDEAKMIGGVGSCGRELCCSRFLGDFQPVSIRMAKEQSLSLNPIKISGACGRLMCCLKYEQDQYEFSRKRLPKLGKEVITPHGRGIVTGVNALLETVKVRVMAGDVSDIREYQADQVQRVNLPDAKPKITPTAESARDSAAHDVFAVDEEFLGTPMKMNCSPNQRMDDD